MNEQLAVLLDVAGRLERLGIPYMLSGSMALNYYAEPRMTRDLDIVIELKRVDADALSEAFAGDYHVDAASVAEAASTHSMFNVIELNTVTKVDMIVRKDSPYRLLEFSRRRSVPASSDPDSKGITVSIVAPEDLVLSKLDWTRDSASEIQLRDVRSIMASVPDLDWEYLEHWADELGLKPLLEKAKA